MIFLILSLILAQVNAQDDGFPGSKVNALMVLEDADGRRVERHLTITSKGDKDLIEVTYPPDVAGTRLLTDGDKQWIWLPALKRKKRIVATKSSFLGSEFSYEDMRWRGETEGEDLGFQGGYYIVKQKNKTIFVDPNLFVVSHIQYQSKTLVLGDYKSYNGYYRPKISQMINTHNGKKTTIYFSDYVIGVDDNELRLP